MQLVYIALCLLGAACGAPIHKEFTKIDELSYELIDYINNFRVIVDYTKDLEIREFVSCVNSGGFPDIEYSEEAILYGQQKQNASQSPNKRIMNLLVTATQLAEENSKFKEFQKIMTELRPILLKFSTIDELLDAEVRLYHLCVNMDQLDKPLCNWILNWMDSIIIELHPIEDSTEMKPQYVFKDSYYRAYSID